MHYCRNELDRYAETLIKIKQEAYSTPEIVKNAPYTAAEIASENWPHKFTREQAAYPLEWVKRRGKFWPTVGRVNNAKGDKVLICSCPEVSAFV
jgi:glycine dehydrogenase